MSRGTPRGRRKASGGGRFGKRVKTRWIRGPGAPKRVKNVYDRGTPHGAVGKDFPPTDFWALRPGPRAAKLRVLGPFWGNLAGSAPGNAPWAVGENFCPTASGGSGRPVRAPGGRIRPEYTCFPVAPGRRGAPETRHSGPAPGSPGPLRGPGAPPAPWSRLRGRAPGRAGPAPGRRRPGPRPCRRRFHHSSGPTCCTRPPEMPLLAGTYCRWRRRG